MAIFFAAPTAYDSTDVESDSITVVETLKRHGGRMRLDDLFEDVRDTVSNVLTLNSVTSHLLEEGRIRLTPELEVELVPDKLW